MVAGTGSVCGEGGCGDLVHEGELLDGLGEEERGKEKRKREQLGHGMHTVNIQASVTGAN